MARRAGGCRRVRRRTQHDPALSPGAGEHRDRRGTVPAQSAGATEERRAGPPAGGRNGADPDRPAVPARSGYQSPVDPGARSVDRPQRRPTGASIRRTTPSGPCPAGPCLDARDRGEGRRRSIRRRRDSSWAADRAVASTDRPRRAGRRQP
jgi:hypothetical protein